MTHIMLCDVWCVELMEDTGADFTMTFRQLSEVTLSRLQKGSFAPVRFLSIHSHSSCNIHNHDFSPLTVTVSLLTVIVGSFRPLITQAFQRLGSAVFTTSIKVMLLECKLELFRGLKMNLTWCLNRLLQDNEGLRWSTTAQNARHVFVLYDAMLYIMCLYIVTVTLPLKCSQLVRFVF